MWAIIVALHRDEIGAHPERISKLIVSADNFFQMHRQFISAIFLMQTIFFPITIPPPPRENNGLSLNLSDVSEHIPRAHGCYTHYDYSASPLLRN